MSTAPRVILGALTIAIAGAAWVFWPRIGGRKSQSVDVSPPGDRTSAAPSPHASKSDAILPWAEEFGQDLPALAAKLRAAGYPESVVEAIIGVLVHEKLTRDHPRGPAGEMDYWSTDFDRARSVEARTEHSRLLRQEFEAVKQALGHAPDAGWSSSPERQRYPSLSADKARQIRMLRDDFAELKAQVAGEANGLLLPADMAKLAYLDKQERAELSQLLTAEEFAEYELQNSNTAENLRRKLSLFKPTEAEFKALFQVQRALDDELAMPGSGQNELALQRERRFLERAAEVLAPDRVAELKLAADPMNTVVNRIVERYELPLKTTGEIAAVQQQTIARARGIAGNPSLPPDDRGARLTALSHEATAQLTGLLGPEAFQAYEQVAGGWLKQLTAPRPARPNARRN